MAEGLGAGRDGAGLGAIPPRPADGAPLDGGGIARPSPLWGLAGGAGFLMPGVASRADGVSPPLPPLDGGGGAAPRPLPLPRGGPEGGPPGPPGPPLGPGLSPFRYIISSSCWLLMSSFVSGDRNIWSSDRA